MKILIKNKKWNIFFETNLLVCDVFEKNGVFSISFDYDDEKITIKSKNIDNTLKFLDKMFLKINEEENKVA